jgi:hypothetical protein
MVVARRNDGQRKWLPGELVASGCPRCVGSPLRGRNSIVLPASTQNLVGDADRSHSTFDLRCSRRMAVEVLGILSCPCKLRSPLPKSVRGYTAQRHLRASLMRHPCECLSPQHGTVVAPVFEGLVERNVHVESQPDRWICASVAASFVRPCSDAGTRGQVRFWKATSRNCRSRFVNSWFRANYRQTGSMDFPVLLPFSTVKTPTVPATAERCTE